MRDRVAFTYCPECSVAIGTQGLARHRFAKHGVEPQTQKPASSKLRRLTLEERLAKLRAQGLIE